MVIKLKNNYSLSQCYEKGLGVSEREMGVVVLHLPIGPLNPCFGLESVPRYEPSTYQPINQWLSHCTLQPLPF